MDAALPEGLDNLAAELAEEDWDEEEDMLEGEELEVVDGETSYQLPNGTRLSECVNGITAGHDKSRSRKSIIHDNDEDEIDEAKIISPDLEQQLKLIETLSKQDIKEPNPTVNIFHRVEVQLRDLSSQIKVEDQATRLSNTANSIATNLLHQDRYLKIILQTYLSPFAPSPDRAVVESLQPIISELISSIPASPTTALPAMHAMACSGTEILTSLAVLGDNLYIAQQNTSLATQKLRSVQDIVDTIRREIRQAEEGLLFLQAGAWEERLRRREAAVVCSEVVNGFEEVCEGWRRRIGGQSVVLG